MRLVLLPAPPLRVDVSNLVLAQDVFEDRQQRQRDVLVEQEPHAARVGVDTSETNLANSTAPRTCRPVTDGYRLPRGTVHGGPGRGAGGGRCRRWAASGRIRTPRDCVTQRCSATQRCRWKHSEPLSDTSPQVSPGVCSRSVTTSEAHSMTVSASVTLRSNDRGWMRRARSRGSWTR